MMCSLRFLGFVAFFMLGPIGCANDDADKTDKVPAKPQLEADRQEKQHDDESTRRSPHKRGPPTVDHRAKIRPGEMCCLVELSKIDFAIPEINARAGRKMFDIPGSEELDDYFDGKRPTCCPGLFSRFLKQKQDYFLPHEGPEPTKHPEVIVYERAGNHEGYRHVTIKSGCTIRVTESQWQRMRQDRHFFPDDAPVVTRPDRLVRWRPRK